MPSKVGSLLDVYRGWDGYNLGLVHAVAPLTAAQLVWCPAPKLRSVGDIIRHMIDGRISWFQHIPDIHNRAFAGVLAAGAPASGNDDGVQLARQREVTWHVIEAALSRWTLDALADEFLMPYQAKTWRVPRQWIIWRELTHDIHHGGELALSLGIQHIAIFELGDLGGHLVQLEPEESPSSGK